MNTSTGHCASHGPGKYINPLTGCVGAIDGIYIKLERPAKKHGPRQFYSKEGFFSINWRRLRWNSFKL